MASFKKNLKQYALLIFYLVGFLDQNFALAQYDHAVTRGPTQNRGGLIKGRDKTFRLVYIISLFVVYKYIY